MIKINLIQTTYVKSYLLLHTFVLASSTDPHYYLSNHSIATDSSTRETSQSIFRIFMKLSIVGLLVTITIAAGNYAITSKSEKRNEAKNLFSLKFVIAICVFGFVFIINTIFELITNLS